MKKIFFVMLCASGLFATGVFAAEHIIEMGGEGAEGAMTFEPAYLEVDAGDELVFKPVSTGHYVRSISIPEGAAPWRSDENQTFRVTVTQPGVYFYNCPSHVAMSMVGIVKVAGSHANQDEAIAALKKQQARMHMGEAQVDTILKQLGK